MIDPEDNIHDRPTQAQRDREETKFSKSLDKHTFEIAAPTEQIGSSIPHVPVEMPTKIGRYRIESLLGKGGFGCVYLAYDDELRRNVTIKVPHAHRIRSKDDVDAFLTEARTLAKLEHPNVVPVHDVDHTPEGVCYIVSRYIDGSDLHKRIRTSPLSIGEAVKIIATIAEALHYVHNLGVIHRDIKPNNILLDKRGVPYLADFGLALLEEDAVRSSSVAGTPAFMSPEQARGENHRVEGTSDIFSLGIVLYLLVTGELPFRGENSFATLRLIQESEVKPLRDLNRDIPAELERICLKALSKRAVDRHKTALDFAEDLQHFIADDQGLNVVSRTMPRESGSTDENTRSSRMFLGMVPRGLRSFGAQDAKFFLGLLPGPYDRDGTPESVLFWKRHIEELDPETSFRVGLIYGPSGCGKSSFVKAGLVPTLPSNITSVFIEAAPKSTETRLLNRLRRSCPYLDTNLGLADTIASLRHGKVMGEGKKVLIVIDQFEQWLYSVDQAEHSELARALRQCDGEHVQCILLVRDDFWLASSRFMDHLEVEQMQNHNMARIDLFEASHARRVLTEFGRGFQRLPEHSSELTRDQRTFINQAIDGLSENGKVTPVRIALFAEMIKSKPWTPATLRKIGGTAGVGVMFLDENFASENAPAEYRIHLDAVYATLAELLPEPGTNLKGYMKSKDELLAASGYAGDPKKFDALVRILDSELHLITRTDPDGRLDNLSSLSQSGVIPSDLQSDNRTIDMATDTAPKNYYQLAHDYLVPAIRDWQARMQRGTRKGRAEIRLTHRAEVWRSRPESRHLPTWTEWASIMALTSKDRWDHSQAEMMKSATWRHSITTIAVIALAAVTGWGVQRFLSWNTATSLADQLTTANVAQVGELLDELEGREYWTTARLSEIQAASSPDSQPHLFASLALLPADPGQLKTIEPALLNSDPDTLVLLCDRLSEHGGKLSPKLWEHLADETLTSVNDANGREYSPRFNAALCLSKFDPPNSQNSWQDYSQFLADELVKSADVDRQYYRSIIQLIDPAKSVVLDPLEAKLVQRDDDQDGLTDDEEAALGTDPLNPDTDNDGSKDNVDAFPLDPERNAAIDDGGSDEIDESAKEDQRTTSRTLLRDLLENEPAELLDRFLEADIESVLFVIELIDKRKGDVRPLLDRVVKEGIDADDPNWRKHARRKATATAILLRHKASGAEIWNTFRTLKQPPLETENWSTEDLKAELKRVLHEKEWESWVSCDDKAAIKRRLEQVAFGQCLVPDLRNQLVQRVRSIESDPVSIARRLLVEEDIDTRCGLMHALGEFAPDELPDDQRESVIDLIKGWFKTAREAKIHANAVWFLNLDHWGNRNWVRERLSSPVSEERGFEWYVNSEGHTMIRLPQHEPSDSYRIEAAMGEVTLEQIQRSIDDEPKDWTAEEANYSVGNVCYHDAVEYCNWLSRAEGLSDDQLCYPDRDPTDTTAPPVMIYPDFRERTGYRLPTADEWYFMCQSGSRSRYSFGDSVELCRGYSRSLPPKINYEDSHSLPIAVTRPNAFGIFDSYMNVREWTNDLDPNDPERFQICGLDFRFRWDQGGTAPRIPGYAQPNVRWRFWGMRVFRSRPNKAEGAKVKVVSASSSSE